MKIRCVPLVLAVAALSGCQPEAAVTGNPVEVGTVNWSRDLDQSLAAAKQSGKPVFLLFQEVPGCAGCKNFGREVLSAPSIVGMIERNFIPVLVHNNKDGKDAEILRRYQERAWNYQVVRFLDGEGKDLIPRKDHVWTREALTRRMREALAKAGREEAAAAPATRQVAFAQHCFWTGEMKLGAIEGTVRTEAGFFRGREVTLVDYDPATIRLEDLIRSARTAGVADAVYLSGEDQAAPAGAAGFGNATLLDDSYRKAPASDQKRQLKGTKFSKLDLTPEQATKVNAFARTDSRKAASFLKN
ncbi:VPGUxxT family thioredoxin-like (seleno)protein, type 2 [Luteolibacter marinus]|uniref:VPGUxxT family thioredoxin-like (seleno)protein, type 2 n=1 Tax=Luteolibacter marinus TaxID=2776705 RepID=UPI001867C27A|nr:VPGUxxT family thioredoxin-like (seleno)protein, type 2 [Luteolibacter marinus]